MSLPQPPSGAATGPAAKPDEDREEDEHLHAAIPEYAKQAHAALTAARSSETMQLADEINKGKVAHAAIPVKEITNLFDKIIGNIEHRIAGLCCYDRARGGHRHHGQHLQLDERPPP